MVEASFVTDGRQVESSGTPVRKFEGLFDSFIPKVGENNQGTRIELNFTDCNILKLAEGATYDLPIVQLSLRYVTNQRGRISDRSNWGRLLKSCEEIGHPDIKELVKQRLTMEAVVETIPATVANPEASPPILARAAGTYIWWKVVGVAGDSKSQPAQAVDAVQEALNLLHGKTTAEFSQQALQNQTMRKVQASIFDGSLVSGLVAQGLAVLEGERYWVVGRPR